MDVLSKIDRGEYLVGVRDTKDYNLHDEPKAELLRLARLGAAAEKGFDIDCNFSCRKIYGDNRCAGSLCAWEDFCKLRATEGAG